MLRAEPHVLAAVRRFVGARLREWGLEDLRPAAAMCVTELLSNVHKHTANPECALELRRIAQGIRVSVRDTEPSPPVMREPDHMSERGRGLFLLSETANAWGFEVKGAGKEVWFVLNAFPEDTHGA
ncbi:ATP-binding protein [Streptomyces sp. RPT161]|uniref:ATP-binding protein n=1 Tax=Streptomyces sp. RPT161 TaxID=3015993 RepID=UPI0022B870C8|nr:ATP-binding protein [Streptomyces sp. RPT161]